MTQIELLQDQLNSLNRVHTLCVAHLQRMQSAVARVPGCFTQDEMDEAQKAVEDAWQAIDTKQMEIAEAQRPSEGNMLLRSAHEVMLRKGTETNWDALRNGIRRELLRQAGLSPDTTDEQLVLRATCTPRTYRLCGTIAVEDAQAKRAALDAAKTAEPSVGITLDALATLIQDLPAYSRQGKAIVHFQDTYLRGVFITGLTVTSNGVATIVSAMPLSDTTAVKNAPSSPQPTLRQLANAILARPDYELDMPAEVFLPDNDAGKRFYPIAGIGDVADHGPAITAQWPKNGTIAVEDAK